MNTARCLFTFTQQRGGPVKNANFVSGKLCFCNTKTLAFRRKAR